MQFNMEVYILEHQDLPASIDGALDVAGIFIVASLALVKRRRIGGFRIIDRDKGGLSFGMQGLHMLELHVSVDGFRADGQAPWES